jgi:hypothetical protein
LECKKIPDETENKKMRPCPANRIKRKGIAKHERNIGKQYPNERPVYTDAQAVSNHNASHDCKAHNTARYFDGDID